MSPLNRKLGNLTLLFLVPVSLFGLVLAVSFAIHPSISKEDFVWRKPMVGSAFAAVCVLGILAVIFPNACSRFFDVGKHEKRQGRFFDFKRSALTSHSAVSTLSGHHPLCGRFSAHVFRLGERTLCATCSGLFLGALIVLVGVGMYFFGNWQIGQYALLAVFVGAVGVLLGLLQSPLPMLQSGVIRMFTSTFLTLGTFLILVGADELAHSTSVGFFLVALTVLWLMTRISLSQWDHERICSKCAQNSCSFAERHTKNEEGQAGGGRLIR